MPLGIPDTKQYPWDQPLSHFLQQVSNKTTGGLNMWTTNPTVGVDGAPLGPNHVGYTGINTSQSSIVRWDGATWTTLMDGERLVSTPQLVVYVNQATGNDNNDGKTASTAWKTISKFYQEVYKYNLLGKQVTLNLGAGAYSVRFPPNTWGGLIRVNGVSNSTVTIQSMVVDKATTVLLQDVTVGHATLLDTVTNYWPITVTNSSVLQLGPNVVLGVVGTYNSTSSRMHVSISNSSRLRIHAGMPITLAASVNSVFTFSNGSTFNPVVYSDAVVATTSPGSAPVLDAGLVYDVYPALTSSNTVAVINATGSVSVNYFIVLTDSSNVNSSPNWKMELTGSILGGAYRLITDSAIYGEVSKTTMPNQGIKYPASISSGVKDTTSTVQGTPF